MPDKRVIDQPNTASVDHVVPRSQGGRNTVANLVTACRACNMAKGSMSQAEFVALGGAAPVLSAATYLKRGYR